TGTANSRRLFRVFRRRGDECREQFLHIPSVCKLLKATKAARIATDFCFAGPSNAAPVRLIAPRKALADQPGHYKRRHGGSTYTSQMDFLAASISQSPNAPSRVADCPAASVVLNLAVSVDPVSADKRST